MIKKVVVFIAWMALLVACVPVSEAATIRISAPKVELELAPGQTYSGEIIAENPTEEEIKIRVYVEDWSYTPGGTGEKAFTPVGSTPASAGKWITFSPSNDTIKPFGRTVARYTIAVPPDAKGSHFAVMFFETMLGTATDEEGVNVLVAGRIGSLFFIEAKGNSERKAEVKSVEIKPPQGNSPLEMVSTFKNTGNTDITVGGKFILMDAEGKIQARGDLNKIYIFPGRTESGKSQWVGRLPKGSYQVLLTYDLGKGKTLVQEKTLVIG